MILLSDANILIDLSYVNELSVLTRIGPTEVLDTVLLECEHENQPALVDEVLQAGITPVATEVVWLREARRLRSTMMDLSQQDRLNFYYAQRFARVLLTGDNPLRNHSQRHGVEVHGSLWLVEQALGHGLIPKEKLCRWVQIWPALGRRLPTKELQQLRAKIGCS